MRVGIPKEIKAGEARVAATAETTRKLVGLHFEVVVEKSAGVASHFTDEAYVEAGATIVDREKALGADVVLKVDKPTPDEIAHMKRGAILISFLDMCYDDGTWEKLAQAGVNAFGLELIPRLPRAQPMDVLSSQANIGGYRAALEATNLFARFFPMMMTSAGSAKAARVVVLGAGVAGLQALATAKRLGAQVWGYDVRPEVKEQVESLGAKFIDLSIGETGEGKGGYAKALSAEAQEKEQHLLAEELKKADVIISTAMIPCRPAPVLITEEAVRGMRAGSVVIDMAAATGGNCPLTEADKTVIRHGVIICGFTNFPALMPTDASSFYSRNLFNLLSLLVDAGGEDIDLKRCLDDDIVACSLVTLDGKLRYQDN
ncbi:MAG: Re/Si-specific NAD(P)(+) transhydrogenase subunit alpha [Proteobacteria bacterium]|nr:Re/Si-specific NAD(P)(+) transhydrogenase subunit alpha [Pseudomonadota bacterium]